MARWWSTASSPPSAIARRRHGWRRLCSVDHVRDDLVNREGGGDVREMQPDEKKREGVKRGQGTSYGGRSWPLTGGGQRSKTSSLGAWKLGFLGQKDADVEGFIWARDGGNPVANRNGFVSDFC